MKNYTVRVQLDYRLCDPFFCPTYEEAIAAAFEIVQKGFFIDNEKEEATIFPPHRIVNIGITPNG